MCTRGWAHSPLSTVAWAHKEVSILDWAHKLHGFMNNCVTDTTTEAYQPAREPTHDGKPWRNSSKLNLLIYPRGRTAKEVNLCKPTRKSTRAAQILEVTHVTHKPCAQKTLRSL
ncbi:unnamed protein product [Prunus armeniaca]